MQQSGEWVTLNGEEQLFLSLMEQLTRPLLQISQLAELSVADDLATSRTHWDMVRFISEASLQLAESYALSLRVQGRVTPLKLEQLTISSLLYDAAHALEPFARQYGVTLELDPGPRMQPVLADRTVLQSALVSLGQVFVQSQAEHDEPAPIRFSAHRGRYGVVTGLYSSLPQLGSDSLRRAQSFKGRTREPLQRLVSGPAAGVFVADSLLRTLATRLHVARYHNLTGLAATLEPSAQLQLI